MTICKEMETEKERQQNTEVTDRHRSRGKNRKIQRRTSVVEFKIKGNTI